MTWQVLAAVAVLALTTAAGIAAAWLAEPDEVDRWYADDPND